MNDTLCQVERCRIYAANYGRVLIVDGRLSGVAGEFGDYFQMKGAGHIFDTSDPAMPNLNTLDCLPAEVRGRVEAINWTSAVIDGKRFSVDAVTGAALTFDFDSDHPEPLLIHQQGGGGLASFALIDKLTLTPDLARHARALIDMLPPGYHALHIRNTDYRTDVAMVLDHLRQPLIGQDLLICSDDITMAPLFRQELPQTRIHQITTIPVKAGALHIAARTHRDPDIRRELTVNSIIELCALAGATRLFVPELLGQRSGAGMTVFTGKVSRLSGFSRLAAHLCRQKPRLRRLLGPEGKGMLPGIATGEVIRIAPPEMALPTTLTD